MLMLCCGCNEAFLRSVYSYGVFCVCEAQPGVNKKWALLLHVWYTSDHATTTAQHTLPSRINPAVCARHQQTTNNM